MVQIKPSHFKGKCTAARSCNEFFANLDHMPLKVSLNDFLLLGLKCSVAKFSEIATEKIVQHVPAQWHVSPNTWVSYVSIEDITSPLRFFANKHLSATAANKAAMFMLALRMQVDHGWRLVRKENENERKEKARERVKTNIDWISTSGVHSCSFNSS